MATKVVHTIREEKQEIQKRLGCMNGIFQLFDRRYLLGLHRNGQNQKKLSSGQGENGEKEFKNSSEKAKEKKPKKVTIEKNRASIESSRNSFSSSCSSTTFSSLDCSKMVQTESQFPSEPTSPNLHKKQQDWSLDIRNVVKDSMTREICVALARNVAKDERADFIKHVDSPRPFIHQKSVQYNTNHRNLAKVDETSSGVKKVKETSRFSCDERESRYSLKSTSKVKELPRLSLDSKQNSNKNSMDSPKISSSQTLNQSQKPGSNKRPSSGVVARLMGLENLTDSIHEVETLKIKPSLDDESVSSSRWSSKVEIVKENYVSASVSPRVRLEPTTPERRFSNVTMRGASEPVSRKQEVGDRGSRKPPVNNKEAPVMATNATLSVYGEMEKRLNGIEFKTSAKNLRALKQILEAMQTNNEQAREIQKRDQPVSLTIKGTSSPRAMKPDSMMITGLDNINRFDSRKDLFTRKQGKDPTSRNQKATGRAPSSLSPSNSPEYSTAERPVLRSKVPRPKNGIQKQCFHRPSSDSSRIKKQSNVQPIISDLKTRNQKPKPVNPMQTKEQSCRHSIETRSPSQDGDTVSFISGSNTSLASKNKLQVMRNDQPKENHRSNFAERLMEDKATTELAKLTMEQPSPVSVLDAFYTETTPSPVKKKPNPFDDMENTCMIFLSHVNKLTTFCPFLVSDFENLHFDETERDQSGIYNLVNDTGADHYSEFNHVKLESRNHLIHQIELLTSTDDETTVNETVESPCGITNGDHRYISEILLASGFLKDLDSATRIVQLHPTASLIKPNLFHLLEKTKGYTELSDDGCHRRNPRSKSNEKIRRLMIFDSVNDILFHKLAMLGSSGLWTRKRRGRLLNGEKLQKELCSEIDHLQTSSKRCQYDEDDEVKDIVSEEVNKNSEDWDKCCYEVPGLVLDIERLIFKDLIDEVVNAELGVVYQHKLGKR
ncbi:protein LONGIFOLIA 1-like [Cynara cardunculus var. scolymus]|uniref:protein LONGIFOLIA 1-like n=1 Tax=Cynara cardunculus var. scolymus TaxID=59895 RepID=UPI000D62DC74|nr:protein LONGIFOLIA 1-like [Cynara cardunculus var. scolymus]